MDLGLPLKVFLGRGFTRRAPSLDGINPLLKGDVLLEQPFPWVMTMKTITSRDVGTPHTMILLV